MKSLLGPIFNDTPVSFAPVRGGFTSFFTGSGASKTQQMASMSEVSTLFAVVSMIANSVSQVNWRLFRKSFSGREDDRTEVTRHAALEVWNNPNDHYTRQSLIESIQQHIDLVGEGWPLISKDERFRTLPLEIWFSRPDRMEPVPHPTEFISGYIYCGPEGEKVPLDLDEALPIKLPNPLDMYRGLGPVQSLMMDLDSVAYSAEWNRNFFLNSAEPGGIIEVDKRLGDTEFQELQKRWNEQHKGVSKAHRVAILEHGKYNRTSFTQRDMQFVELRNISREMIREAYRLHKHMLGLADDVNRANAVAASTDYAKWVITPRLERWKQWLNFKFLPLFGDTARGLEFDYDSPVPIDPELENSTLASKTLSAKRLVDSGYDPAQVLAAVDLPEIPWTGVALNLTRGGSEDGESETI